MPTGYDQRDEFRDLYATGFGDVEKAGYRQDSNGVRLTIFQTRVNRANISRRAGLAIEKSSDGDDVRVESERLTGVITGDVVALNHRFRTMMDELPIMVWASDRSNMATYFNKSWLGFTGSAVHEVLGDTWTNTLHPEDRENFLQTYKNNSEERKPFQIECRLRRHDGEYLWVVNAAAPHFSDGIFDGYVSSCTFIETKQQKSSELFEDTDMSFSALDGNCGEIIGRSNAVKNILLNIKKVAATDSTVLITGETGTGKELIARAVHASSSRKDQRLVTVNCAALTSTLIESELFGHEKGAFTGAGNQRQGRFELASGGTIFLDEIGELPIDLQAKLLRVLEQGEFERVGGTTTIRTDARIIAATNRDLKKEVLMGNFRRDLWYRLNVFQITSPPLRERVDDIPVLVKLFVSRVCAKVGKPTKVVSPAAMRRFRNHPWPGNIRELANVVERAVILSPGETLELDEHFDLTNGDNLVKGENESVGFQTLEELERDHISRVLSDRCWRIEGPNGAARVLGMNPSTLRTRINGLSIRRPGSPVPRH